MKALTLGAAILVLGLGLAGCKQPDPEKIPRTTASAADDVVHHRLLADVVTIRGSGL